MSDDGKAFEKQVVETALISAAIRGAENATEVFRSIYVSDDTPAISFLATLMRLKMIEINLLETAQRSFKLEMEDLLTMSEDARRTMTVFLASTGGLSREWAASFGGPLVEGALTELSKKEAAEADPGPAEYAAKLAEFKNLVEQMPK